MFAAKAGIVELGTLKAATVHQEFRVLRRIFNVARAKKLCPANPCAGVEFPVKLQGPVPAALHDLVGAAEDRASRSRYLRNVIRIITETGLRVYKELAPMRKDQVDLANKRRLDSRIRRLQPESPRFL